MRILGIDTAVPAASVALVDDDELLAEETREAPANGAATINPPGNHAETLIPLIARLLRRACLTVEQLSGIAVSIGPGSFTGLRIGLATAKGIAYESGAPLVGISTLHATAARVNDYDGVIGALLDARKGEVYMALFRRVGQKITRLAPDSVLSIKSAIDFLREHCDATGATPLLVGNGARIYERRLRDALGSSLVITGDNNGYASVASQVARLGCERFTGSTGDDVGLLTPVYLRISEAEKKRRDAV